MRGRILPRQRKGEGVTPNAKHKAMVRSCFCAGFVCLSFGFGQPGVILTACGRRSWWFRRRRPLLDEPEEALGGVGWCPRLPPAENPLCFFPGCWVSPSSGLLFVLGGGVGSTLLCASHSGSLTPLSFVGGVCDPSCFAHFNGEILCTKPLTTC